MIVLIQTVRISLFERHFLIETQFNHQNQEVDELLSCPSQNIFKIQKLFLMAIITCIAKVSNLEYPVVSSCHVSLVSALQSKSLPGFLLLFMNLTNFENYGTITLYNAH